MDVIVNPTSSKLELDWGSLSKSVLALAGPEIQRECTLNYPDGITSEKIAVTSAGRLKDVKSLFHITCPAFRKDDTCGKSISKLITNCLNKLVEKDLNSIAIPSVGAGGLGYPANLVAKSSLNSIVSFLNLNRKKKFKIRLIIYEKDLSIHQASLISLTDALLIGLLLNSLFI